MSLPKEIASREELIEAQAHVWNHTSNYINSMCLKCAIQLGIPDAIHEHGNPITLSQLVEALPINKAKSEGLFRLMRILVHSKFFEKVIIKSSSEDGQEKEAAYSLTTASRLLLRGDTLNMGPIARFLIDPIVTEPWHHLSEWFCNDLDTPFKTKHGRTVWEYTLVDKEFNVVLNEAMACDAGFLSCILNEEFAQVFEGFESMVDVGGGTGAMAMAIAAANPGLKCVVFDLPHVVGGLHGCGNLSFVSGDMFECIPQANAIFMKFILHDWDDEDCVEILKKCKEALTSPSNKSGGKVIIVEIVMDDEMESHEAAETKLFMDMQMLNFVKGKERSEEEWSKLFLAAGFSNYKVARLLGLRSVIEVFP